MEELSIGALNCLENSRPERVWGFDSLLFRQHALLGKLAHPPCSNQGTLGSTPRRGIHERVAKRQTRRP